MSNAPTTTPTAEPVSLFEIKKRLHLSSTADDDLIQSYIPTARAFVEKQCGCSLASKSYAYSCRSFPWPHEAIQLPTPPVSAVTSVQYLDASATWQTWDASEYMVGLTQIPAVIRPRPGFIYPTALRDQDMDTVLVTYQSGPATGALGLDFSSHYLAIQYLVVHFYEHPSAVNSDDLQEMPYAIQALINTRRYRSI